MPHTALLTCTRNNISENSPVLATDESRRQQHNRLGAIAASDNVSVETVERALCATGYLAMRSIQVEIERGIVVLWGHVPTYYQKQVAQVTAQRVPGVRGIANGIEVVISR